MRRGAAPTTEQRDTGTTGYRVNGTMGQRDNGTSGHRTNGTTGCREQPDQRETLTGQGPRAGKFPREIYMGSKVY
jgi:hypothetical protein